MTKYSLIKDGAVLRTDYFETQPTIAASKGVWYEVIENDYPSATELEVVETTSELVEGKWTITHTKRYKTPLELWHHKDLSLRIKAPISLLEAMPGIAYSAEKRKLMVEADEEFVYLYCNTILPAHQGLVNQYQNVIEIEETPTL